MHLTEILIVFACLALGGMLKGATGAGAPVLAVPAIAMLFDVRFAVVVMLAPNLFTNLLQAWRYRRHRLPARFLLAFAFAGGAGVVVGTVLLASLSGDYLSLGVAGAVFIYIAARLAHPGWSLPFETATRFSAPAGLAAGMLQGASGMSAPISLTFLNAMKLDRPVFISTVSVFFTIMTVMQIPALGFFGLLNLPGMLISLAAVLPILGFMPVGAALARRLSRESFDRAILVLLTGLAVKLVYDAVVG